MAGEHLSERQRLIQALEQTAGNRRRAGELLGISRATLYRWFERFDLDPDFLRVVAGRYEICGLLGRGGQGIVFRVKDRQGRLGEKALKLLSAAGTSEAGLEKVREEYRIFALLRHPCLLRVHQFGVDRATGNRPYLVTDLVEGRPFVEAARQRGVSWIASALGLALKGVDHLHRHGCLHRDLKSENILLGGAEDAFSPSRVTVMDFGLAGHLRAEHTPVGGTLPFIAPEVLLGHPPTVRSDLYAMGVTAYLALTGGRLPHDGDHRMTIDGQSAVIAPPSSARREIPPELDHVVLRLLAQDPEHRFASAGEVLDALAPLTGTAPIELDFDADQSQFVGREEEIQAVLAKVLPLSRQEAESSAPLVLVQEEAGLGKSRFLEACVAGIRSRAGAVALAVCQEPSDSALAPVKEILTAFLAGADGRGEDPVDRAIRRYAAALATVAPELTKSLGTPGAESSGRFHIIDGLVSLLCELAESKALVLVIDDLHLADPLLLDLLWHLSRRARRLPLRILAAARPMGAAPASASWLKGAGAEGLLELFDLPRLSTEAVRKLAELRLGPARAALLADQIWSVSGGHPLFVHQLVQELAERAVDQEQTGEERLPSSLKAALHARLARVDEHQRELLFALATAGQAVEESQLRAVVGEYSPSSLGGLIERGILRREEGGRIDLTHATWRETLLRELPEKDRRRWHRAWAEQLRREGGGAVARAEQWLAAEEGARACRDLLQAAELLFSRWQYAAAARYFAAALERIPRDDPQRLAVHPRLARAWREARDVDRLEEVCRNWARDASRLSDRVSESRALSALATAARDKSDWTAAKEAASRAITLAEEEENLEAVSMANKILASVLWEGWEHQEALVCLERAIEISKKIGDKRALAYSLQDVGLPYAITGRSAAGIDAVRRARELFRELDDTVWELLVQTNEALIFGYLGDLERAAASTEEMIEELSRRAASVPVELALENLVFLLNRLGRYEQTQQVGRRLLEHAATLGRHEQRIAALLGMGEALFQLGQKDSAAEHHRLAHDLAEALGIRRQLLFADLAIARDLRDADRRAEAKRRAEGVLELSRSSRNRRQLFLARLELARLARLAGSVQEAQHHLDAGHLVLDVPSEDSPALRAQLLLERARAWEVEKAYRLAIACAEEGLGLATRQGPVETEIELLALRARLQDALSQPGSAALSLALAGDRIRDTARQIRDTGLRARYLGEPWRAKLLAAAPTERGEQIQLSQAAETLSSLYEVCEEMTRGGEIEALFQHIVKVALERCGAERGLLLLRHEQGGEQRLVAAVGLSPQEEAESLRLSRTVQARVDREGQVLISDVRSDPDLSKSPSVTALGIRSVMGASLRMGDKLLGTLYVDSFGSRAFFRQADLRFLRALADQAAMAVSYAQLVGRMVRERDAHRHAAASAYRYGNLVSRSKSMRRVFEVLEKVADTSLPVLILGESGTGKELVARALHFGSSRRERIFLSENCAAIPENLLESILFGHARGAFTGAERDKPGLFELADGGTLLLDEVGEMSPGLQSKLLRVLQEGEFRPVGSDTVIRSDVRVITATHRDITELVREGAFRQDLYFRLNGMTVQLPPLRERQEDIPLLAQQFLEREAAAARRPVPRIAPAVMRVLTAHDWPGNVRELENTVRRLLLISEGKIIGPEALATDPHFSTALAASSRTAQVRKGGKQESSVDEAGRLQEALERAGGNKERAAALLGISRATLYRRLRRHGLLGN